VAGAGKNDGNACPERSNRIGKSNGELWPIKEFMVARLHISSLQMPPVRSVNLRYSIIKMNMAVKYSSMILGHLGPNTVAQTTVLRRGCPLARYNERRWSS